MKNGDLNLRKEFNLQVGSYSSVLEQSVPELMISTPENPAYGISATKALQLANEQSIPVYTITKVNEAIAIPQLQIDSGVIEEIQNAVNAGMEVTVSKTPVNFFGHSVVGYIIVNPITGDGAYRISGGINGMLLLGFIIGVLMLLAGIFLAPVEGALVVAFGLGAIGIHLAGITFALITKDYTSRDWDCFFDIFFITTALLSPLTESATLHVLKFIFERVHAMDSAADLAAGCP